jgi:aminocarboxymuconate-semialdehyde decarboxylase
MLYIDAFNHFFPKRLWDRMCNTPGATQGISARMQGIPAIFDLDTRMKIIEQFGPDYRQIISLGMPPLDLMGDPATSTELAKLGNDGMAELCQKYPDHFAGFVASLPMNAPEEAVKEAERAFKDCGANGLQIHSNVGGVPLDHPRFFGVFETAAKHDKPVLLHPVRNAKFPDYQSEEESEYEIWWTFGWPYETSAAMARFVFSGLMDKLPDLKILAHHLGAMIPYFEGRVGPGMDQLGSRTTTKDLTQVLKRLKKRPLEYFQNGFYADTATFGGKAAMVCGLDFFPSEKVLFASDCPFDPEKGPGYIRDTIAIIEALGLDQATHEAIAHKNAQKLFKLSR